MRRVTASILDDPRPPSPRLGWRLRSIAGLIVLVALLPFAFDGARMTLALWQGLGKGEAPYVATPALDALGDVIRAARAWLWGTLGPYLHDPPWKPVHAVVAGFLLAILGTRFLRGRT
jgi:hypothetical protein